jgi:hypothetical protein
MELSLDHPTTKMLRLAWQELGYVSFSVSSF